MENGKISKKWVLGIIALSFVSGVLGGGAFDKLVMPFLRKELGKSDSVIIKDNVESVTVEESSAVIDVVKKASPSVVTIVGEVSVLDFFGDINQKKGAGTGFVLTADGLILTNKHVVSEQNAQYTVVTSDGNDYDAKVLTTDPVYDLAIIKIEAKNLKVVELGDSGALQVGQRVVAIGNALGEFDNTVTTGVISAKGRPIVASDSLGEDKELLEGLLQTDAAINPGNSGGPLLNLRGQVIGINTAVANAENIGFAIPVDIAKPAIDSTLKTGKIVRPMMGVRYIAITRDLAALNDLPLDKGAWIYSGSDYVPAVLPDGPAAKAGLMAGDIIKKIGDQEIDKSHGLAAVIQDYKPGDEVDIVYFRNNEDKTTKVKLSELSN